jgi:hypothetical protein
MVVILADMAGEAPVGAEGLFVGWMEAGVVLGGLAAVGTDGSKLLTLSGMLSLRLTEIFFNAQYKLLLLTTIIR